MLALLRLFIVYNYFYIIPFTFQLRVIAYDTLCPINKATADVTINVIRDNAGPVYRPSTSYQVTIPETLDVGSIFISVDAIDADGVRVI